MKGGRPARLAEALRGELSGIITREVKDPRVAAAGLLTVTHVRLTDDLRLARVLVSFIGGDPEAAGPALEALTRAAGWLQGELGRRLSLKRAPELRFEHDRSAEHVAHIEALLRGDDE